MISRHHTISEKTVSPGFSSRHFLAFRFVNLATGTALAVAGSSCPGAQAPSTSDLRRRSDV